MDESQIYQPNNFTLSDNSDGNQNERNPNSFGLNLMNDIDSNLARFGIFHDNQNDVIQNISQNSVDNHIISNEINNNYNNEINNITINNEIRFTTTINITINSQNVLQNSNENTNNYNNNEINNNEYIGTSRISTFDENYRFSVEKYIRHIKTWHSNYFHKKINELLKITLKLRKKIYKFNYKNFTKISAINKNKKFLKMSLSKILELSSPNTKNKNIKLINSIKKYPYRYKKLNEILSQKYENSLKDYYDSPEFQNFKRDAKTQQFEKEMKNIHRFSFLENYGVINFINDKEGNKTYRGEKI